MSDNKNQPLPLPGNVSQKGVWRIGEFYTNAWNVVKNHKKLWIVGFALSASSSGCNSNFQGGSSGNDEDVGKFINNIKDGGFKPELDGASQVLGANTDIFNSIFGSLVSDIPIFLLVLLGVEILLVVLFFWAVFFMGRAWATGTMIAGVDLALKNTNYSLTQISNIGLAKIKSIIWLAIVPNLLFIGLIAIGFGVGFIISGGVPVALLIILGLILVLIIFILFLFIFTSIIYAQRLVVLENYKAFDALKLGFKYFKKKIWWTLVLGIVNTILIGIISFIPLVILGAVGFGGYSAFTKGNMPLAIIVVVPLFILMPIIFPFIGSIAAVFKVAVWNQAYRKTKEIING